MSLPSADGAQEVQFVSRVWWINADVIMAYYIILIVSAIFRVSPPSCCVYRSFLISVNDQARRRSIGYETTATVKYQPLIYGVTAVFGRELYGRRLRQHK